MDICNRRSYGEEMIGTFYEKEFQKTNQTEFTI